MDAFTLAHAKEHLEDLIERAARGEDVRIDDAKGTSVRLVPTERAAQRPGRVVFGQWSDLAEIGQDRLLAPLSDEDLDWLSGERSTA